jgi:hypothetical protein
VQGVSQRPGVRGGGLRRAASPAGPATAGAGRPARPLGLSDAHISTLYSPHPLPSEEEKETKSVIEEVLEEEDQAEVPGQFVLSIAEGGEATAVREVGRPRPGAGPGGKRGKVRGLSPASRRRLMRDLHSIDRRAVVCTYWVTMTQPAGPEGRDWHRFEQTRQRWEARFLRRWGSRRCVAYWRKEETEDGTLHLHLLIYWIDNPPHLVKEFRPWNDVAWAESCDMPARTEDIKRVGCQSEFVRLASGLRCYISKYVAKPTNEAGEEVETGRVWGIIGRRYLPLILSIRRHVVSPAAGKMVRRVLRKHMARRRRFWLVQREGGRWARVRPLKLRDGWWSVEDQVAAYRRLGQRVKLIKPRVMSLREYEVWGLDEDSGRYVCVGTEKHSFAPSVYLLPSSEVARLVKFVEVAHGLDVPF